MEHVRAASDIPTRGVSRRPNRATRPMSVPGIGYLRRCESFGKLEVFSHQVGGHMPLLKERSSSVNGTPSGRLCKPAIQSEVLVYELIREAQARVASAYWETERADGVDECSALSAPAVPGLDASAQKDSELLAEFGRFAPKYYGCVDVPVEDIFGAASSTCASSASSSARVTRPKSPFRGGAVGATSRGGSISGAPAQHSAFERPGEGDAGARAERVVDQVGEAAEGGKEGAEEEEEEEEEEEDANSDDEDDESSAGRDACASGVRSLSRISSASSPVHTASARSSVASGATRAAVSAMGAMWSAASPSFAAASALTKRVRKDAEVAAGLSSSSSAAAVLVSGEDGSAMHETKGPGTVGSSPSTAASSSCSTRGDTAAAAAAAGGAKARDSSPPSALAPASSASSASHVPAAPATAGTSSEPSLFVDKLWDTFTSKNLKRLLERQGKGDDDIISAAPSALATAASANADAAVAGTTVGGGEGGVAPGPAAAAAAAAAAGPRTQVYSKEWCGPGPREGECRFIVLEDLTAGYTVCILPHLSLPS